MVLGFVACGLSGFLTGLLCFKVKSRWCPQCGATTTALAAHRQENTGAPGE